jgi:hypothetical protein
MDIARSCNVSFATRNSACVCAAKIPTYCTVGSHNLEDRALFNRARAGNRFRPPPDPNFRYCPLCVPAELLCPGDWVPQRCKRQVQWRRRAIGDIPASFLSSSRQNQSRKFLARWRPWLRVHSGQDAVGELKRIDPLSASVRACPLGRSKPSGHSIAGFGHGS